jgi:hypothetical protein
MLLLFTGFMAGIAADFSLYLTFINGGSDIENLTILPEECQEESGSSSDGEIHFYQEPSNFLELIFFCPFSEIAGDQNFSVPNNGFYDIPYSPPEQA